MSRQRTRRGLDVLATATVALGVIGALLPLGRVLEGGSWLTGAAVVVLATLTAGAAARTTRWPGAALVAEVVVWAAVVTATQLPGHAIAGFVPGADAVRAVDGATRQAFVDVVTGVPPLEPSASLTLVIAAASGILAIVVDQLAVSARVPLAGGAVLVAVTLVPSIAVTDAFEAGALATIAVSTLGLCAIDVRRGSPEAERRGTAARRLGVTGVAVAAVVIGTLVATPALPGLAPITDLGRGASGTAISTTLDLGADLRAPADVEVLRVRGDADVYLRALTVSSFDDAGWRADPPGVTVPVDAVPPLDGIDPGVARLPLAVDVQVTGLRTPQFPVPYAATAVTGAGGSWAMDVGTRTIGGGLTGPDLRYAVAAEVVQPTMDQLRGATADGAEPGLAAAPVGMPPIIADLAAEVTAGASTDYDRLVALQDWFRGDAFRYSLTAPSRLGFDDGSLRATAQFLLTREGYCVHFASAFTLMARSLGMPARVVVGYLPGAPVPGDDAVRSVSNRQLHAWPEVHFDDLGWIGFEPTHGTGEPAALTPTRTAEPTSTSTPPPAQPAPTATVTLPPPTAAPTAPAAAPVLPTAPPPGAGWGWLWIPVLAIGAGVLLLPALIRLRRDRTDRRDARRGDPLAAWAAVRRQASDLGLRLAPGDSPRTVGDTLVDAGAPAAAVRGLVTAVERRLFAGDAAPATDAATQGRRIRAAIRRRASILARLRAVALPPSSFRRRSAAVRRSG